MNLASIVLMSWSLGVCGPGADNITPNCTFDTDIVPWQGELAVDFHWDPTDGNSSPGALTMTCSAVFATSSAQICFDDVTLAGRDGVSYWADLRLVDGTLSQGCSVHPTAFSGPACGGVGSFLPATSKTVPVVEGYLQTGPSVSAAVPQGTQSLLLEIRCICEVFNGTVNIDDVFLGANVFLDDFESGGTDLWTATSP